VPGQEKGWTAEPDGRGGGAEPATRVRDDELVGDRGCHDAGDHRLVEVGVGGAALSPRIGGRGDHLGAEFRGAVEVDPPKSDGDEGNEYERGGTRQGHGQGGERTADQQDRLA
jgi:hypothetical protein